MKEIAPLLITFDQMGAHPDELVKIAEATFPKPGDMMFGNTNIVVSDNSGAGEMRINGNVSSLVGLAQPATCGVTGVVKKYFETYELLPRMKSDLPCADKYKQIGDDLAISHNQTLDVVAWNIEWFGDEANSPAGSSADVIQKDSVVAVLKKLDADIYAVEEISDDALFAQMVGEMNGYGFVLSDATSYPNEPGTKQKVGFIYKTSTVSVVNTRPLLASIHPYYNGGDASAIADFPDPDKSRFYASGRLPFLMVANVAINGTTKQYDIIAIHARANDNTTPQAK
jgi:hypothetical protein